MICGRRPADIGSMEAEESVRAAIRNMIRPTIIGGVCRPATNVWRRLKTCQWMIAKIRGARAYLQRREVFLRLHSSMAVIFGNC